MGLKCHAKGVLRVDNGSPVLRSRIGEEVQGHFPLHGRNAEEWAEEGVFLDTLSWDVCRGKIR